MSIRRGIRPIFVSGVAASVAALALAFQPAVSATGLNPTPAGTLPDPFISGHAQIYGWGAATLSDGSVIMGDYWNLRVLHFAADGTLLDPNFIANAGFGPGNHQAPYGLAVDPVNGDIYMADTDRKRIHRYSYDASAGTATRVASWGANGSGLVKYLYPSRVAIDSNQRVYVADTWDNNIEIDTNTGVGLSQFGAFGSANGQFKQPHGMSFDYNGPGVQDDRLFVVDTQNKRIQVFKFNPASGYVDLYDTKFGCAKLTGQPGCVFRGDLRGLAIDQANDWVYIVDAAGNQIHKYGTDGTYIKSWGKTAVDPSNPQPGEFSDGGREITVAGDGTVWVGDMPNFRFQVFTPDGQFVRQWPDPPAGPPEGGFNGPRGVAVDPDGNVFVTDTYNQRIEKFDANGSFVKAWGKRGRGPESFNYPRLLAIDPRNGDVVVADTDNHTIKKYDNDGVFLWGVGGRGTSLGKFRNPHGIDVGPDGMIYVADSRNARVVVLDPAGTPVRAFGSDGTGEGQFKFPRGIAVDTQGTLTQADDSLWVVDSVRDVVQHLTMTGDYLGQFGSKTVGAVDRLDGPFGVETDGQYVYVADSALHVLKAWANPGPVQANPSFVMTWGSRGTGVGQMIQPQGLDLDPTGQFLYVSEQKNDRIQKWELFP